jgi:hypothetical protein
MPGLNPIADPAVSMLDRSVPATGAAPPRRHPNIDTGPLASMTLRQWLHARNSNTYAPQDIWHALVNPQTFASRELRNACDAVSPNGQLFGEMVTLLTTQESARSLDRLADAGIFLVPARAQQLRPEDTALLRSDEGLMLWLEYAATPTSYMRVFDGSDVFGIACAEDQARIDKILHVLVACGRDSTNAPPSNPTGTASDNPLSHLCSQIAPQWLRRLLELGASPNQLNSQGLPLVAVAMRAQALRLYSAGYDPLDVHDSLRQLAQLLWREGADLNQMNSDGIPAVALLAFHGLCGAAEALLSTGANPNSPDRFGNTLMHHLACVVRLRDNPARTDHTKVDHLAHYALIVAARYGGDLTQPNTAGHTPRSSIPASLSMAPQIEGQFIDTVRNTALFRIKSLI